MQCTHIFFFATDDSFSAWAINSSTMHRGLSGFGHVGERTRRGRKQSVHPANDTSHPVVATCSSVHDEPFYARETKVHSEFGTTSSFKSPSVRHIVDEAKRQPWKLAHYGLIALFCVMDVVSSAIERSEYILVCSSPDCV